MDEHTYITCPVCGNPECDSEDSYCFNCSAFLKNYCTNKSCMINNCDEFVELPGNMCYCPECGEETFFMEQKYIQPQKFK